ncbi:coumaroyl-CoA:anthocyanidin 3-O-glucoside-6''-O-coumaroyltransferase 1-like [Aristolochia californica]|uniref:coumaroyl-CoA:anthocyanidin 3-O-glucoside-6''-O-coumaroyltransferase 1-like n=1 Tax=Aristolochia californica TaxID=171875 RepID=UPI0035DA0D98
MAVTVDAVKVLEQRRVSLPLGSVPPADLPLTYFDVTALSIPPIQQLFFYDFSCSTQEFRDLHFPQLEHSLSLALTLFYPFAGRLVPLMDSYPGDLVIRYSKGDCVPLTLAESRANFARLAGNQPKEAKEFHSLVSPILPVSSDGPEGRQQAPLAAFQVTVFPGAGITIGFTVKHVVADGLAGTHFLKSWASIFKAGGDISVVKNLPFYDRTLLGDLEQLKRDHLEREAAKKDQSRASFGESEAEEDHELNGVTRSTFVLTRAHIKKLHEKIFSTSEVGPRVSTFTVASAFLWVCLAKSREVQEGKTVYFGCAADCRPRLDPPLPASYFGNCIRLVIIEASQVELTGEKGLIAATEAIHSAIRRLDEGALKDIDSTLRKWEEVVRERPLTISASPRFRMYETDFGWGCASKVEIVTIDSTGAMSMAENTDEEGGIEIGVAGPDDELLRFTSFFEEGLRALMASMGRDVLDS